MEDEIFKGAFGKNALNMEKKTTSILCYRPWVSGSGARARVGVAGAKVPGAGCAPADGTPGIYCYSKLPLGEQSCRRCPIIWAVDFNSHCVLKAQQNNSGKKKRRKKKNPHSTWMALFPPALLVYLYSKLKI